MLSGHPEVARINSQFYIVFMLGVPYIFTKLSVRKYTRGSDYKGFLS
jgi:hypothetical protein